MRTLLLILLLFFTTPTFAQRTPSSPPTSSPTPAESRIPAPVAPYMQRASSEDILAQPTIQIEGNQDNIDPTLIDSLAVLMVGRADIRSPYIIEDIKQQIDGITRISILVAHFDPTSNRTKCYRLQYPLESLAKMSWLRTGEPIRTRKVKGWIAIQLYTFETTPFSTSENQSPYVNNPNYHLQELTLEVPIQPSP